MLKKAWLTEHGRDAATLTLESVDPASVLGTIAVQENRFPAEPTTENPLHHTICLSMFTCDDLEKIREAIDEYLDEQ